ncbi:MAG TPA: sporulation integral membrane protein YtvI [Candidatus Eisenbergiella stercorigallinarum]|uniref:Sporulation integral membrane protein YtvI n=1 Tax=Candidatus Eisenbergiella stercorigallinarum TaxID=2838557 RepID=A0A9D2TZ69_9FIRM|nr:sporulation integral membrane protein YtvI [Candidatus Eisenbergiella stercorigallinarum]
MWPGLRKYVKAVLNLVTAVVLLCLTVFLLPRLLRFFMPFAVGWIIAMIANPLVRFCEQKIRIRRKAGSAIVIVAVLAGVILVGYLLISRLVTEAAGFVSSLPTLWRDVEREMDELAAGLADFYDRFPPALKENLTEIGDNLGSYISGIVNGLSEPTVNAVGNIARNIPSVIVSTIMCLLSSYFFVAEKENIHAFFHRHVPESIREKFRIMSSGLTGAVGGYFVAQFRIEIVIYFILFIGLLILRVQYSFLIAFLIAVLDFLPVFGAGAVLWPWALMEVLAGNYRMALGLMIIWGVAQLLRQVIQPKFVGDSIGVPAIPTLFLLFIGYRIGSVLGMILAVPVGIVVQKMFEAGLFNTTIDSVRILLYGFNHFRKLEKEDLPSKEPAAGENGGKEGEKK